eukprot:g103.t1
MDDAWEEPGTQNANVESDAKKSKKATPASKKVVSARKGKAKQAKKKGPKERSSKVSKAKTTRTKSAQKSEQTKRTLGNSRRFTCDAEIEDDEISVDCEDISHVVKSVEFTLHSSFTNPVRVIKNHPFELTEYGWGEFEVKIRLNFNDPGEKPLDTYHALRLYPPGGLQPSLKRPVVSEYYDEVVFNRPSDSFSRLLLRPVEHRMPLQLHPMRDVFARFDEERDLKTVTDALAYVEKETRAIKQRIEELS